MTRTTIIISSKVLKFADDTKVLRKVNTDGDKQHLQNDLVKWSEKWQILNFGKCKYRIRELGRKL